MPKSKKRKKRGKTVSNGEKTRLERFANMESGVTLQDLINVVAYQEYVETGEIEPQKKLDFSDPETQAVIRAVEAGEAHTCEIDGCYGQNPSCAYNIEETNNYGQQ